MVLYIKYMVCDRCKKIVEAILETLQLKHGVIELGVVELEMQPDVQQLEKLRKSLSATGLELLDNRRSILVERTKNVIIELVHYVDKLPVINYSDYISTKLNYDYTYLANIFSLEQGVSIRQFIIRHRIEKVKQLLSNNELSLKEISDLLHFSSTAHLSNQFKKQTGISPGVFRKQKMIRLCPLDRI